MLLRPIFTISCRGIKWPLVWFGYFADQFAKSPKLHKYNHALSFIHFKALFWNSWQYKLLDTGRKLNVHKTFIRHAERRLKVLCTLNLRHVSKGRKTISFTLLTVKHVIPIIIAAWISLKAFWMKSEEASF